MNFFRFLILACFSFLFVSCNEIDESDISYEFQKYYESDNYSEIIKLEGYDPSLSVSVTSITVYGKQIEVGISLRGLSNCFKIMASETRLKNQNIGKELLSQKSIFPSGDPTILEFSAEDRDVSKVYLYVVGCNRQNEYGPVIFEIIKLKN